jgi:ComF family protein
MSPVTAAGSALRGAVRRLVLDPVLCAAFPTACVACAGALDEPSRGVLCRACLASLPRFEGALCACGTPLAAAAATADAACGRCRRGLTPWSLGASIGPFDGGLRLAIHALKYGGRQGLARTLARTLAAAPGAAAVLEGAAALVPVPLHALREKERGFNQSALVARALAAMAGTPVRERVLMRARDTPPQTGLSAFARRRNVAGAFQARFAVDGAVVLVDDVMTTGATAAAAAAALRASGAAEVRLLTLARVA